MWMSACGCLVTTVVPVQTLWDLTHVDVTAAGLDKTALLVRITSIVNHTVRYVLYNHL